MMIDIHDGHRDRMRDRIIKGGIELLHDHEVLEYILYAFIPRKDTNPIAHRLLDNFGKLNDVFDASVARLEKIDGMTRNAAIFLHSLSGISRRYYVCREERAINVNNVADCISLMKPILSTVKREELHLLLRDTSGKLIRRISVSKGQVNEVSCSVREITDAALSNEAVGMVLIHNHPSGVALPSHADVQLTERIYLSLSMIGVSLDDHIIIAGSAFYSFKQHGYMEEFRMIQASLEDRLLKQRAIRGAEEYAEELKRMEAEAKKEGGQADSDIEGNE